MRCFCHYLIWKQGKSSAVYTEEKCIHLYDVIVAILSGIHTWLLHLFCIESTIKTNFWPYINQTFFQNLWAGKLKFLGLWPEVSPFEWSFYSFMFLFGGGNKLPYRLMQYFDSKELTLQNCKKKKRSCEQIRLKLNHNIKFWPHIVLFNPDAAIFAMLHCMLQYHLRPVSLVCKLQTA